MTPRARSSNARTSSHLTTRLDGASTESSGAVIRKMGRRGILAGRQHGAHSHPSRGQQHRRRPRRSESEHPRTGPAQWCVGARSRRDHEDCLRSQHGPERSKARGLLITGGQFGGGGETCSHTCQTRQGEERAGRETRAEKRAGAVPALPVSFGMMDSHYYTPLPPSSL